MQTLEQKYAAEVYEKVKVFATRYPDENDPKRKQYGSMAHKLPVLIRTAGLVQALAFADSRGKDSIDQLLEDLAQVIGKNDKTALLERSRKASNPEYIKLSRMSILALTWFKRFAQSILNVEPTDEIEGA